MSVEENIQILRAVECSPLPTTEALARLVGNRQRPVQIVFAGKSHPADEEGKRFIRKVFQATCDERFGGRIVFVEDHDINVGRHMVQGVDLWLNTPRRPLEACGTSGMKAILNGGLNLSTLDGWWAQAYDGTNGFAIGYGGEHVDPNRQDELDVQSLYEVLENQVVPLFYERDEAGVPRGWVAKQKNAIRTLAWRLCAHRMMTEYALKRYLPAAGGLTIPQLPGFWTNERRRPAPFSGRKTTEPSSLLFRTAQANRLQRPTFCI